MKKFIEDNTYQSSFKEIDNLYSHISTKEIQPVFQNLPAKKAPRPDGFTGDVFQSCKKEISIHTNSSRKWKEKNTSQFVLWSQNYHNTKDVTRNECYRAIFFMNTVFVSKAKFFCFCFSYQCLTCCHLYSQVNWTNTTHFLQIDTIFYDFCSSDNFISYPTQPGCIWFLLSTKLKRKRENQRNRINFPKSSHLNSYSPK